VVQDPAQVAAAADQLAMLVVDFDHGSTSFRVSEMGFLHPKELSSASGLLLSSRRAEWLVKEHVNQAGPAEALAPAGCLAATALTGVLG
jgi:hypothetical protein